MADLIYLSLWVNNFNETNMMQLWQRVIEAFPASAVLSGVRNVAVYPFEWGETPVAFVVLTDPAADPEAIRAAANEGLGRTQRIRSIHVLDELPRSAIGKVLKRELRDRLAEGQMPSV